MPGQKRHFYSNPYLLLTLTALFWSGNMVLGRGIRADVPPMALAFWRWPWSVRWNRLFKPAH